MKLKTTHAMAICALTLVATQSTWAALPSGKPVEMQVKGVIKPGNCAIELGNGGVVNYNEISKDMIKENVDGNALGEKIIPIEIKCDATTQVGIDLVDEAHDTVVNNLQLFPGQTVSPTSTIDFGLGQDGEKNNIGAYRVFLRDAKVGKDESYVGLLDVNTTTVGSPRTIQAVYHNYYKDKNLLTTWVKENEKAPTPGTSFTGNLRVVAAVNTASKLDLSSEIELGGKATMTVYYL